MGQRWARDGTEQPDRDQQSKAYRAFRYGQHLDLIITDQHSYRSADCFSDPSLGKLGGDEFTAMSPESLMQILDGGRAFNGAKPPEEVRFNDAHIPNPQRNAPPQTLLGAEQKAWFKEKLKSAKATWKIWANSMGVMDHRADPQNLPPGLTKESWPKDGGYANMGGGDFGTAYLERAEIYNLVRDAKITGFAIVSGDLHSFWAGYAAAELPPGKFEPVGLSFVGASLTSPGPMEGNEHNLKKDNPLRSLFLADKPGQEKPDWTFNMLLRHGVRSCLEYAKSFDLKAARALSNPDLAPAPHYAQRKPRRWATQVSGSALGCPLEERRAPAAKNLRSRRRYRTLDLTQSSQRGVLTSVAESSLALQFGP